MITALLALVAAQAAPQAEIGEASVALATCTIPHLQAGAAGPGTAEAIADSALSACAEPVARLRAIFVRMSGEAGADTGMQLAISGFRARLIQAVNERRGLVARPNDAANAWGDCIRANATALASHSGTVEVLADETMRQCAAEEASVREGFIRRRGAEMAAQLAPLVAAARDIAIQTIRQARASREDHQ